MEAGGAMHDSHHGGHAGGGVESPRDASAAGFGDGKDTSAVCHLPPASPNHHHHHHHHQEQTHQQQQQKPPPLSPSAAAGMSSSSSKGGGSSTASLPPISTGLSSSPKAVPSSPSSSSSSTGMTPRARGNNMLESAIDSSRQMLKQMLPRSMSAKDVLPPLQATSPSSGTTTSTTPRSPLLSSHSSITSAACAGLSNMLGSSGRGQSSSGSGGGGNNSTSGTSSVTSAINTIASLGGRLILTPRGTSYRRISSSTPDLNNTRSSGERTSSSRGSEVDTTLTLQMIMEAFPSREKFIRFCRDRFNCPEKPRFLDQVRLFRTEGPHIPIKEAVRFSEFIFSTYLKSDAPQDAGISVGTREETRERLNAFASAGGVTPSLSSPSHAIAPPSLDKVTFADVFTLAEEEVRDYIENTILPALRSSKEEHDQIHRSSLDWVAIEDTI